MRNPDVAATLPMLEYVARRLMAGPPRAKTSGFLVGPWPKTKESLSQYAALFAERDTDGFPLTLMEIGRRMGVTREYVRQIRKRYFPELDSVRVDAKVRTLERKTAKRFRKPRLFRSMVRRWLKVAGYFQCCHCRAVKCRDTELTKHNSGADRCKRCTADSTATYYGTERGQQRQADWVASNQDRVRTYQRRWHQKRSAIAPQPCPRCGLPVCGNRSNRSRPMRHKRPDGAWCAAAVEELPK